MVYAKKPGSSTDTRPVSLFTTQIILMDRRALTWSQRERSFAYRKDWDFVGGNLRVYQVYGMPSPGDKEHSRWPVRPARDSSAAAFGPV